MAAFHFYHQYTPPLRTIERFPGAHDGIEIDEDYLVEATGLAVRPDRDRIERPEYLGEFGIHYWTGSPSAVDAQRSILESTIRYANQRGIHWNLWHYKDVRGMGLLAMREDTPWTAFLREAGVADLAARAAAARERYVGEIEGILPLTEKRRFRLASEAERDFQLELLYDAVGHLRGRSLRDLEELAEFVRLPQLRAGSARRGRVAATDRRVAPVGVARVPRPGAAGEHEGPPGRASATSRSRCGSVSPGGDGRVPGVVRPTA